MNDKWKTTDFFRMWPRALFHMKSGKPILERHFGKVHGVYVLYRRRAVLHRQDGQDSP